MMKRQVNDKCTIHAPFTHDFCTMKGMPTLCMLINSSNWWRFCVEVLSRGSHRKYTKGNGQLLVAGKRLILGVRGPGEKPSWGET